MDTKDIIIYAVVDEYRIPFAVTRNGEEAESLLEEWILDNVETEEDDDGEEYTPDTDAGVWEESLEEFLKTSPGLLSPEQLKSLVDGELVLL